MKKIEMLLDGESPDLGAFKTGNELTVADDVAKTLQDRGVCRVLSEENKSEGKKAQPPTFQTSQEV